MKIKIYPLDPEGKRTAFEDFPIYTDRAAKLTANAACEVIRLVGWGYNDGKNLQLLFALGYLDEAGVFHRSKDYPTIPLSIPKDRLPGLWAELHLEGLRSFQAEYWESFAVASGLLEKRAAMALGRKCEFELLDDQGKVVEIPKPTTPQGVLGRTN